jgi:hypothetical protein
MGHLYSALDSPSSVHYQGHLAAAPQAPHLTKLFFGDLEPQKDAILWPSKIMA